MAQISSSPKVVSLHMQKCSGGCPNASVCYHKNKAEEVVNELKPDNRHLLRIRLLEEGYKIHESVCEMYNKYYLDLAKEYPNYNITISHEEIIRYSSSPGFKKKCCDEMKDQVQVSVYDLDQIEEYKDYQKLFLIKDFDTLGQAFQLMKMETGKLHFIIDKKFLSEVNARNRIRDFINNFQNRMDPLQSADTCLTGWLINGHCPHETDYLDITYDRTARKCPYASKGIVMNNLELDSIEAYMTVHPDYHYTIDPIFKCIYKDIFKGESNEQRLINTNLQNQNANNGSGSNTKRVRGLSLRR